jgi:tetratricopeptide (TPR) repeat protein
VKAKVVRSWNDKVEGSTRDGGEEVLNSAKASPKTLARRFALVLLVFFAGLYIWWVVRIYQSSRFAARHDGVSLQRAIGLQPRNAESHDLLGQYLLWQVQDPRGAAVQFSQAAKINPYASAYWMHLAEAENNLGNDSEQVSAIRKAIAVDPTTPELAWSAANVFLIQGDTKEALDQFAVVIRSDPALAPAALERSWRALGEVDPILDRLPPEPAAYLSFIKILVARQQWTPAQQVWLSMLRLNRQFDPRTALFYVDALLARQDVPAAQKVWQQIVERSSDLKPYITPGNLIVNAGFNREFLNSGFDWHYSAENGVAMVLDPTQTHEGSEALLITYAGPANEDAGISQFVPVVAGAPYVASAWVRSEELETANGPQLTVFDGIHKQVLARSDETLGSTGWHQVQATFTAPKDTNLVLIRFWREPASTRIQGRFWIDNVQMHQVLLSDHGQLDR